jgi:hypothetical protein
MQGEAVYSEAARRCKEGKGNPPPRAIFESSRLAPLSYAARELCKKVAVELAICGEFAPCLGDDRLW